MNEPSIEMMAMRVTMNIHIRIPQQLYDEVMSDLIRPHPFAAERIGFFSVTTGRLSSNMLVIHVGKYHPIPDRDYVDDQGVGARIGGGVIRGAPRQATAWLIMALGRSKPFYNRASNLRENDEISYRRK